MNVGFWVAMKTWLRMPMKIGLRVRYFSYLYYKTSRSLTQVYAIFMIDVRVILDKFMHGLTLRHYKHD